MNKLRYREDLYAKEILENGFITKYNLHEMKILVKYYKSQGIKPKERKKLIYEFCEKYIKDFNRVLYYKRVNSALNVGTGKFNNLIIIKDVPVTNNEIDHINNLELDYIHRKVVFTLLVQNKINKLVCDFLFGKHSDYNFFGGKKQYYKEILNQSKIPSHSKIGINNVKNDINKIINDLDIAGTIKMGNRGRINLLFVDGIKPTEQIVFNITTFDDIGYYYDYHNGENSVIKCEKCDKLVKTTGKNHRMCRECWKEHRRIYTIEKKREYRKR